MMEVFFIVLAVVAVVAVVIYIIKGGNTGPGPDENNRGKRSITTRYPLPPHTPTTDYITIEVSTGKQNEFVPVGTRNAPLPIGNGTLYLGRANLKELRDPIKPQLGPNDRFVQIQPTHGIPDGLFRTVPRYSVYIENRADGYYIRSDFGKPHDVIWDEDHHLLPFSGGKLKNQSPIYIGYKNEYGYAVKVTPFLSSRGSGHTDSPSVLPLSGMGSIEPDNPNEKLLR